MGCRPSHGFDGQFRVAGTHKTAMLILVHHYTHMGPLRVDDSAQLCTTRFKIRFPLSSKTIFLYRNKVRMLYILLLGSKRDAG